MTTQKTILLTLIISTILSFRLSAQIINETPFIKDVLVNEDSLQGINDDSLGFINKTLLYFYYKNSLIYLNESDTVRHNTSIQRNYSDQFLRIYNDKKILPASRIFAFSRDHRYYRSVSLGNRYFGFAELIESGKMNLFCIDDILSYGEVKAVSEDGNNPDYTNYLLMMDYDRRKYRSQSYLYFISFDYNKQELIPVKAEEFAIKYLKVCPQASDYLKRIAGNSGSKTLRNFLSINFFSSLFASLIIPNEINQTVGGVNNKTNYAYIYTSVSGGAFLTYSLLHKKRLVKRENIQQAVRMYNACVK